MGIIFNLVEEVVCDSHGEQVWDEVLTQAGASGVYTSLRAYPDAELLAIAAALGERTGMSTRDVIRHVGEHGMPSMASRAPHLFESDTDLRGFLLSLNDMIHPEVRKLYPGAQVPVFTYHPVGAHVLRLGYRSQRAMCELAEGLILGASNWFAEPILLDQPKCVHRGDSQCVLEVTWP